MTFEGMQERIGNKDLTLRLEARQAATKEEKSWESFNLIAHDIFLTQASPPMFCGTMRWKIENEESYL